MSEKQPVLFYAKKVKPLGDDRLRVYRCTKPWHPQPCWHTKCVACGEVVTAFDFSPTESLEIAQGHECKSTGAGAP